jgi:hypothetical protein
MRYQFDNVSREIALGKYPDVSLLRARQAVLDCREKLKLGVDPLLERCHREQIELANRAKLEDTFGVAAQAFLCLDKALGALRIRETSHEFSIMNFCRL